MQRIHVGILFNNKTYLGIPNNATGVESIDNYEEAAVIYGLIPCYLRLQDLNLTTGQCTAYLKQKHKYVRTAMPIPSIIHNRAIYTDAKANQTIEKLLKQGFIIFNTFNRYGKDEIYKLLNQNTALQPFLPHTEDATTSNITDMMTRYNDLILKPCNGSIGRGIMRLQYVKPSWELTYTRPGSDRKSITQLLTKGKLPLFLRNRILLSPYIIQERIQLATYKECPYDLRVTIQRGLNSQWQITGMFAKVALSNTFVTNIARGGGVFPIEYILSKSLENLQPELIIDQVGQLALRIAHQLERHIPFAADLGMDIGLTSSGHPYFIECNGRDQRYGFRKANLMESWKSSYRQPMGYARFLFNQEYLLPYEAT
ncbi:MAG TPA: YheC/YheD family protein [Paenibacillus sp.]